MKAILLMAHGAPRTLDEVDEYVLRVRHGRPLDPKLLANIRDRYRQIGGSPLLQWTQRQAEALQSRAPERKVYAAMRHSHPFIKDVVAEMAKDQVESFTAICLAPQFSSLTIGAYQQALDQALASPIPYSLVRSYAKHPKLIAAFTSRLRAALQNYPDSFVVFTAHSLPERVLQQGDPYDYEVKETARLVALAAQLKDWRFAYQSQGLTSEKWLGPTVESRLDALAQQGCSQVMIAPIGFVCDHVEILYDIDIFYRQYAEAKGIHLHRMESLNDSPEFIDLLATLADSV